MNRGFIFCLSIIVFISCSKRLEDENIPTFSLNPNLSGSLSMREFVDSVSFIKLETNRDALIWEIGNVYFTENDIVVVDRKNEQVLIYDRSGNYISKIHKKGRGPEEYLNMSEAYVDNQNRIIVFDYWMNKLVYYSFTGEHLKSVNDFCGKTIIRNMINTEDGNFICYDYAHGLNIEYAGDLWRVDSLGKKGEILIKTGLVHPSISYPAEQYLYYLPDGKTGFMSMEDENNYVIDNNGVRPYLKFTVQGKTARDFSGIYNEEYIKKGMDGFTIRIWTQHKNNYVFIAWSNEQRRPFFTLYNNDVLKTGNKLEFQISDDETILLNARHIEEDYFEPVGTNATDLIVTPMSGIMVQEALTNWNLPSTTKKKLESLVTDMTEDEILSMNPVLQILHIK